MLEKCMKISQDSPNLVKIGQKYRTIYMKTEVILCFFTATVNCLLLLNFMKGYNFWVSRQKRLCEPAGMFRYRYIACSVFVYGYCEAFFKEYENYRHWTKILRFLSFFYCIHFPQTCEAALYNYKTSFEGTEIYPGLGVRLVRSELQSSTLHSLMCLWCTQTNRMHYSDFNLCCLICSMFWILPLHQHFYEFS